MALDENKDLLFGQFTNGLSAIMQNIESRVLHLYNDCYYKLNEGIDWFNLIHSSPVYLQQTIKQVILASPGVQEILDFSLTLEGKRISLYYSINTIYSQSIQKTLNFYYGNL